MTKTGTRPSPGRGSSLSTPAIPSSNTEKRTNKVLSTRGLVLALKTVQARQVREGGKAALAVAAARLFRPDRDEQVARVRAREKSRLLLQRVARRDWIYGDAVAEANQIRRPREDGSKNKNAIPRALGSRGSLRTKSNEASLRSEKDGVDPPREQHNEEQQQQHNGGWKIIDEAQAVEARLEEVTRRKALKESKKYNAAFLESQERFHRNKEIEVALECVEDRRRLARDAEESEQSKRKEVFRGRREGRALRDARTKQIEEKEARRLQMRAAEVEAELLEVERIKALDRAEAWAKEKAQRAEKEKNRLNKEENVRLMRVKVAQRKEDLRKEHRMQLEYAAKMNADEEKKQAELRKMQDRQTKINERMSAIYDNFKAAEVCLEQRAEEEQRQATEMKDRRGQEQEVQRRKLLQEQMNSRREQERLLHRRLIQDRNEDLAAAAGARDKSRQAVRQANAAEGKRRDEARRIQRLLEIQIAEKARARAEELASGGMAPAERALNRTLLRRAVVTVGCVKA